MEIVKALVSPCEKLIGAVQSAIGKAYEPRHIKKMADAKAYEIATVGNALRESSDIPIVYNKSDVLMDTTDWDLFVKRTQNRLAYQELRKQANIEAVVDQTYRLLDGQAEVDNTPVDEDWMQRFFDSVQDVSNEHMQAIWARILAGEINHPGKVSMRTLDVIRNINKEEAETFQRVMPFILFGANNYFVIKNEDILAHYGLTYSDILLLDECGFINATGFVSVGVEIVDEDTAYLHSSEMLLVFHHGNEKKLKVTLSVYPVTKAGIDLLQVLGTEPSQDYFEDISAYVVRQYKKDGLYATMHRIKNITNDEVDFDDEVIKEFK